MAKDITSDRKSYLRDDGVLMVEVRPGQFINEELAGRLGLIKPASSAVTLKDTPASRQRRQRTSKVS